MDLAIEWNLERNASRWSLSGLMQAGMANPAESWSGGCSRSLSLLLEPLVPRASTPSKMARYPSPPIGSWAMGHPENTAVNAGQLSRSWIGFRHRERPAHHLAQAFRLPLLACAYPRVDGAGWSAHQPPIRAQKVLATALPCSTVSCAVFAYAFTAVHAANLLMPCGYLQGTSLESQHRWPHQIGERLAQTRSPQLLVC